VITILWRCNDCRKLGWTGLPSAFDPGWISRPIPVEWRCRPCYEARRAEVDEKTVEIIEVRKYLIRMREVVPLLSSVAIIVMTCLEIAWHTHGLLGSSRLL
jgi:hypothetical protein